MATWQAVLVFVCGILTSYALYYILNITVQPCHTLRRRNLTLAIGVMSAPGNFERRAMIRSTWKPTTDKTVQAWFIIGNKDCPIHPENRIDKYGCKRWNANFLGSHYIVHNHFLTNVTIPKDPKHRKVGGSVVDRLHFKVMCSVYVKRIGVVSLLLNFNPNVTVQIIEAWSENVVASVQFSPIDPGIEIENCMFQPIPDVILYKSYEYIIEIENLSSSEKLSYFNVDTVLNNFDGAIYYHTNVRKYDTVLPTMWLEVKGISDIDDFKRAAELDDEWRKRNTDIRQQLESEADEYQDILFVDTVDVYRSLPIKLLSFHQWLFRNAHPSFILKTDDDCVINLNSILKDLSELKERNEDYLWWGQFRKQWLVQKFGKWAEFSYTADVYPEFACGSGNVVNTKVHEWIANNADQLHMYQGEDVSMGIWMAAISPVHIEDKRWQCSKNCSRESLSIPELQPLEIKERWRNLQLCDSLCNCEVR